MHLISFRMNLLGWGWGVVMEYHPKKKMMGNALLRVAHDAKFPSFLPVDGFIIQTKQINSFLII
jgi:hypothetical protein